MNLQKLQDCANSFWRLFENSFHSRNRELFTSEVEWKRHHIIVGCTAIDAQLCAFWESRVLPEWDAFLTLVRMMLEDETEFKALQNLCGSKLTRAQLKASLKFIEHTGEPQKFSPSFVDVGIIFLLIRHAQTPNEDHWQQASFALFQLQKIRNSVLHTGRDFNELGAHEGLFLINQWIKATRHLHPVFHINFTGEQLARVA